MDIFYTLQFRLGGQEEHIDVGMPDTEEERREMFALRFRSYRDHGYIEPRRGQTIEMDEFDEANRCAYFIASYRGRIFGSVRLIQSDRLPLTHYFRISEPETLKEIPCSQRCEIGRLIVEPYDRLADTSLPPGVIMFLLILCLLDYAEKRGLRVAYAFIKQKLRDKMVARKMPLNTLCGYQLPIPEDDVLYRYFSQADDPVIPVYFLTSQYRRYVNRVLNNPLLVRRKSPSVITLGVLMRLQMRRRLGRVFWRRYFTEYDVLNQLIPYQELLAALCDALDVHPGENILDAGSGTGNLSLLLEEKGARVTGFDSSEEGVLIHRMKSPGAHVVIGNLLETLPFADQTFDKIVSNNVLYTIPKEKRLSVMKEFSRVLKSGGIIVISNLATGFKPMTIYLDHIRKSIKRRGIITTGLQLLRLVKPTVKIFYYNYLIKKEHHIGDYDFFSLGSQAALLEEAGFHVLSPDTFVYSRQAVLSVGRRMK